MDLKEAQALALTEMSKHGLTDWAFIWSNGIRTLGYAIGGNKKIISLSKTLTELNDREEIHNTILHEVAHALVGHAAGHGPIWRAKAREIGCDAQRTSANAVVPEDKYRLVCKSCGRQSTTANRRSSKVRACGKCCKEHNGGRFTPDYALVWELNTVEVAVSP